MILTAFHQYAWLPLVVWACVYIGDYLLTFWGAALRQQGAQEHFLTEPSTYELNPIFQGDVARRRLISPRFFIMLGVTTLWFVLARAMLFDIDQSDKSPYDFALGVLMLMEVAVYHRHLGNIVRFFYYKQPNVVKGQVTSPLWLGYRVSAWDFAIWAAIFLLLFFITNHWFFIGGVAGCLYTTYSNGSMKQPVIANEAAEKEPENVG